MDVNKRIPSTPSQLRNGRTTGSKAVLCRCGCGAEKLVRIAHLTQGRVVSCGCEREARFSTYNVTVKVEHGLSQHIHYNRWGSMMHRCYDPAREGYHRYGGRGIKVADVWHDPAVFIAYLETILGDLPDPSYTMDRIDNDGNYEPGNIRWASPTEQRQNQDRQRPIVLASGHLA